MRKVADIYSDGRIVDEPRSDGVVRQRVRGFPV